MANKEKDTTNKSETETQDKAPESTEAALSGPVADPTGHVVMAPADAPMTPTPIPAPPADALQPAGAQAVFQPRNITPGGGYKPVAAVGDPFVGIAGATQSGVVASAPEVPAPMPALDTTLVNQMAMALAAAQAVPRVMVTPAYGLDDTTKNAKPYVINSVGMVVDPNGVPVDPAMIDEETKAQAAKVRLSVPGVVFADKEV